LHVDSSIRPVAAVPNVGCRDDTRELCHSL
jgi:hypothetical protein